MAIKVSLVWDWIEWKPGYTWTKDIEPQLQKAEIKLIDLKRCV
jgi:hypothetical protein